MNEADKAEIITRYKLRLQEFGADIRSLASGTPEHRIIRFGVLAGIGDMDGCSILDVGCGHADFYAYLKQQGVHVEYTGYDICPEFIEMASAKYADARFELRDIQVDGIPRAFDFVVSSQTFNNRLQHEDNLALMKDVLSCCYDASRKGVAVDMLTSYVDFREPHLYYYSPEEVFVFCKHHLTKRVTLRHDYPLFEFAVYLYRDFAGWRAASTST